MADFPAVHELMRQFKKGRESAVDLSGNERGQDYYIPAETRDHFVARIHKLLEAAIPEIEHMLREKESGNG